MRIQKLVLVAAAGLLICSGAFAMAPRRVQPVVCDANIVLLSFSDQMIESAYIADQLKTALNHNVKVHQTFTGFSTFQGFIQLDQLGLSNDDLSNAIIIRSMLRPWDKNNQCVLDLTAQTIRNRRFANEPTGYVNKLVSCDGPVQALLADANFESQVRFMVKDRCPIAVGPRRGH